MKWILLAKTALDLSVAVVALLKHDAPKAVLFAGFGVADIGSMLL